MGRELLDDWAGEETNSVAPDASKLGTLGGVKKSLVANTAVSSGAEGTQDLRREGLDLRARDGVTLNRTITAQAQMKLTAHGEQEGQARETEGGTRFDWANCEHKKGGKEKKGRERCLTETMLR